MCENQLSESWPLEKYQDDPTKYRSQEDCKQIFE